MEGCFATLAPAGIGTWLVWHLTSLTKNNIAFQIGASEIVRELPRAYKVH